MSSSPLQGDASNDPSEDQTGRFVRQPNGRVRPLSPHLQVWRWHVTMLGSILHRVTGGALYFGILAVAIWVVCAAFGPDAFAAYCAVASSPPGLLVWFGLTLAGVYHLFSGIRHLVWDTGAGLTPKGSSAFTTLTLVAAAVVAAAFWAALFASGKVSL
jgi:succinate dehydrogenase / fumarate reductase cytochrome b subunit